MTTLRTRARTRLAALATATLLTASLGACAHRGSSTPEGWEPLPRARSAALTVRFDNEMREHVHVYLVHEQREWALGRVEPGVRASLRIPRAAAEQLGSASFMQLVVVPGASLQTGAARQARATFTMAEPGRTLVTQAWTLANGQLVATRPPAVRGGVARP